MGLQVMRRSLTQRWSPARLGDDYRKAVQFVTRDLTPA
jgi:hypothetical protein